MSAFDSDQAFRHFERTVLRSTRFVREVVTERFLAALLQQAKGKVNVLPKGSVLWRAQLGHAWETRDQDGESFDIPAPFPKARMKPLRHAANEGRANPKGIPYVYLATHRDTALAEVRPWIGSEISCGQFETTRELRVVNCTEHGKHQFNWGYETPEVHWDDNVWSDVDAAFSKPVISAEDSADYAPTQIIAELFKVGGFDGLAYESALGEGHNVVLFDLEAVSLINCGLYRLKNIAFDFTESANPYFITKS